MPNDIERRIACLRDKWIDETTLRFLYGIALNNDLLMKGFESWSKLHNLDGLSDSRVNRHAFELYFQNKNILPIKFASARIGMTTDSFNSVVIKLKERGDISINYVSSGIVQEYFLKDLRNYFPSISNKLFFDEVHYLSALHKLLDEELGLSIEPVYCVTSKKLEEKPLEFGMYFDCLTDQHIGLRYKVWLEFDKPAQLEPDKCSLLTYISNKDILKPYIIIEPDIPEELRQE